jgi:hypothetical protein
MHMDLRIASSAVRNLAGTLDANIVMVAEKNSLARTNNYCRMSLGTRYFRLK